MGKWRILIDSLHDLCSIDNDRYFDRVDRPKRNRYWLQSSRLPFPGVQSLGSRAWIFQACKGLRPRRIHQMLAISHLLELRPFALFLRCKFGNDG